ncbi:MAG: hypothetical protein JW896_00700, partial [Deltaproteobacteria bacterium]|nr:hypothetical protein [Deltaproteobacteria bacterium]
IKAIDGSHLWSKTYDRELKVKELFAVQEDIATCVADELKLTFGIDKASKQLGGTDNMEAYENFLVAKVQITNWQRDLALRSIEKAIELDPEFALAWTLRVVIYWYQLAFTPGYRVNSDQDLGLKAALRAVELEPNLAEAYYSLGLARLLRSEFIEAESAYREAMKRSYDPINCHYFGLNVYSIAVGNFERANEFIEAFRQGDPLNSTNYMNSLIISGILGDVQQAEDKYAMGNALFDQGWEGPSISMFRLGAKDVITPEEIVGSSKEFEVVKAYPDSPKEGLAELRRIYIDDSKLDSGRFMNISVLAAYYGDYDFAMESLEKAVSINGAWLYFSWFPVMKEVRQLPRFKEWAKEIGLVDYWKEYGWPDLCHPVGDDDFVCN